MNVQIEEKITSIIKGLGSLFIKILLIFFIPASLFMLCAAIFQPLYFFIFFSMVGIISLGIYYFNGKRSSKSLNGLFLIDLIVFLLYFICIFLIFYTIIDPRTNFLYYLFVLKGLKSIYFILFIPLGGIIVLTYYYIKLNLPIGKIRLSIVLSILGVVITVFIVTFYLLDWSIPMLDEFYRILRESDEGFDLIREFLFF